MKRHIEETLTGVFEKVATHFGKQLTSIIEKIDKQNKSIVVIKDGWSVKLSELKDRQSE